jgi:5-formyltetrahydrofolate cyclo-ligase
MMPNDSKAELRRVLLAQRVTCNGAGNSRANQAITEKILNLPEVQKASVVCVYVSAPGEVNTHALIDRLEAVGVTVVVPKIVDRTRMQANRFPGWKIMQPGPMGILAPPQAPAWDKAIDVAIIPGLGFSPVGHRLGFGAGYYDRWLAARGGLVKIGLGFEFQILPQIPITSHDVTMDLIVTESRLERIGGP